MLPVARTVALTVTRAITAVAVLETAAGRRVETRTVVHLGRAALAVGLAEPSHCNAVAGGQPPVALPAARALLVEVRERLQANAARGAGGTLQ